MKKFLCLFVCLAVLLPVGAAHAEKARKNVLYLNSYHNGYAWSDDILQGLRSFFSESDFDVDMQIEYMDTKRFATPQRAEALYEFYRDKFKDSHFDLIIVSDDFAYNFILDHQDRLWPGLPVVFCGVNDFRKERLAGRSNITGVIENTDYEATFRLAARLHPETLRVIVIGDRSVTGAAIQLQIREVEPRLKGVLEFEYWDDLPLETILERLRKTPNAMLFIIPVYLDYEGHLNSADEVLKIICDHVSLPAYSCWRFLLGHGCVGGKMHSGVAHGRMAARLAFRILTGEKPYEIPMVTSFDDPYAFDYNVLRRMGIPLDALPSGAEIINEPYRFYTINKSLFWTIMVSLVVLVFILVLLVTSIIQRRRIQERVNDQLSFLKILMDAIPLPLYSLNRRGLFQDCNLAFERLFGVRREDISGRSPEDIDAPGATSLRDEVDRELLAEAGVRMYESALPQPGEPDRDVMVSKATYQSAKGDILGLVGVLNDISGLKRVQEELRQAEEKYRGIFANSVLGIFRATTDGNLQDANRALIDMLGHASLEELKTSEPDFLPDRVEDQHPAPALPSGPPAPGGVAAYRRQFVRPDGRRITAFLHIRAVAGPGGAISAFEGVVEDITQRENAERALSESQRMLQLVLDTIPQLVSWKDHDLRYLGVNRSFLSFFGLEGSTRVLGRTDAEIFGSREFARSALAADSQVIEKNQAQFRAAWHAEDGFGRAVLLEVSRVPMHDGENQVVGLLCAAEDVTEKINLERQLLQSQKMEAIGTLAGGIAHDFNNILTSILNSAELALMDANEGTEMAQDLLRVLKAGQRGSQLVRQILAFSRPSQAGFQAVNVAEVARETLSLLTASLPRNISVRNNIRLDPALCLADPIQLHQVFLNLCTNSFQAMREVGGDLLLTLRDETLDAPAAEALNIAPGRYLKLTISDTGPGIPKDILDKIFDPFFTTKGKAEGTGLGLAVVHGIVKGHKGAVVVTSTPWERTTFDIFLPLLDRAGDVAAGSLEVVSRGQGRILFVEDDMDQIATVPRVLGKLGYEVTAHSSAAEALRALDTDRFDLVLTDFDMPDVNGVEFARRLLSIRPGLRVVMISGRLHTGDIPADLPENIVRVLAKPYTQAALSEALSELLGDTA
jgi:PAS domain S-box-containing protein